MWEAGLFGGRFYWPDKISDTLERWVEIFQKEGYELTDNPDVEPGFEKIAIYVDLQDMQLGHVAFSDGITWKSKLGKSMDIEHASIHLLEGFGIGNTGSSSGC